MLREAAFEDAVRRISARYLGPARQPCKKCGKLCAVGKDQPRMCFECTARRAEQADLKLGYRDLL
jgi:hypothetical protein